MVTRWQVLKTPALSAAVLAAPSAAADVASKKANTQMTNPAHSAPIAPEADAHRDPLANFERARALMQREGLDALVVCQRVNVKYVTGYTPFLTYLGFDIPGIAIVPRERERGVTLVASAVDVWRLSQSPNWHPDRLIPFTAAANPEALPGIAAPEAFPAGMGWPIAEDGVTPQDQAMLDYVERYGENVAASPQWGLIKALEDMALMGAVIGYDDPAIPVMLAQHGAQDVTCRDAANLMRRIRMVKTPGEIALMRHVSQNNAASAHAVMEALEPGMTVADIDRAFSVETAKRGLNRVFIVAGSLHNLPHGEVCEGTPILIDAVSEYQGYHGDFGRTFLLGEAPRAFRPKTKMLQVAWQAAFGMIKPGVRYSDIRSAAIDAVRKEALGEHLPVVNPHSVGLQHTDEPGREGMPGFVKDDIILEAGMTMTVDLPHVEPGWGAAHLEDMIVVTENGAEPLNDMSRPVVEL